MIHVFNVNKPDSILAGKVQSMLGSKSFPKTEIRKPPAAVKGCELENS